jgi:hypothetical protein
VIFCGRSVIRAAPPSLGLYRSQPDAVLFAAGSPVAGAIAYQDALKRIPDPKEKYDPWGMTKTPDADKKPSK